jgi:Zn finger protein HypA/HybF involved in hydrogenase expression
MSNKATQISQKIRAKKDSFFADFSEQNNKAAYYEQLGNQNYYNRNRPFFLLCVFLAVAAQGAAAFSSYSFLNSWVSIKVTNIDLALVITVALLLTIEGAKYFSVHSVFQSKFSLAKPPINYVALIIALIVSVFSMFASVKGGGHLGIDETKVVTAKSEYDSHILQVREEIADIKKRNTWRGNTYIAGKEKTLLMQKEATLADARTNKDKSLGKIEAENAKNQSAFQYAFLTIEVLFFLFTFFQFNYKYHSAVEFEREKAENTTQEVTNQVTSVVSNLGITHPVSGNGTPQQKKIGFSFGNIQEPISVVTSVVNEVALKDGNRNCLHCGAVYEYKIINQKFCCEKCRVEAWQLKTGKSLAKKGGKI